MEILTEQELRDKLTAIEARLEERIAGNLLESDAWAGRTSSRETRVESVEKLQNLRDHYASRLSRLVAKANGRGALRSVAKMRRPGR